MRFLFPFDSGGMHVYTAAEFFLWCVGESSTRTASKGTHYENREVIRPYNKLGTKQSKAMGPTQNAEMFGYIKHVRKRTTAIKT